MANGDDGGTAALGGGFEGTQGVADALIAAGTDAWAEEGHQRVEDDQGGIDLRDDGLQERQITGEGEGTTGLRAIGDGDEGDDALRVATGGVDAGPDGVEEIVLGGEEEDAAGSAWSC